MNSSAISVTWLARLHARRFRVDSRPTTTPTTTTTTMKDNRLQRPIKIHTGDTSSRMSREPNVDTAAAVSRNGQAKQTRKFEAKPADLLDWPAENIVELFQETGRMFELRQLEAARARSKQVHSGAAWLRSRWTVLATTRPISLY